MIKLYVDISYIDISTYNLIPFDKHAINLIHMYVDIS